MNLIDDLINVCRAAKAFIDDDAEPYPEPGGYTLAQMKSELNRVLEKARAERPPETDAQKQE